MPTNFIRKLSKEGHGSVESLEKKWDEAKKKAHEEGKGDNYAYITEIFKNMAHASVQAHVGAAYSDQELETYARVFANPK